MLTQYETKQRRRDRSSSRACPTNNARRFSSHTTSGPARAGLLFAFSLHPSPPPPPNPFPPLNKNQLCRGSPETGILRRMKVEEIAEAVAKLQPDQFARFRRWFNAFEAGRGAPAH